MKTLLILGGGIAQLGLIKTAKSMGHKVIVVGINGDYPGYQIADKVYYVDIFDKEAVLKVALKESIDGVCMACSDFALSTLGYINDKLGLMGLTEQCADNSSDKFKMKKLLKEGNVPTPKFDVLKNDTDVDKVVSELSFPVIVKAVDLHGSRGIYICKEERDLKENYKKSIKESRHNYCIVEEFLEGEEFGTQAFVQNGKVLFVIAHGDIIKHSNNCNVPIGHYMPLYCNNDSRNEEIRVVVEKSIYAMGFDNCAVNVDLIEKDGKPYVIELTGRAGANSLPELMSKYLGFNYYEMIITNALGNSVKSFMDRSIVTKDLCVMARQLFSSKEGFIRKISYGVLNSAATLDLFVKEGSYVRKFTNSADCIGRIIYKGKNYNECNLYLDSFVEELDFEIDSNSIEGGSCFE